MATVIRPEISTKSKYYIDKHRHYELKHFCLQYPIWKRTYAALLDLSITSSYMTGMPSGGGLSDTTSKSAIRRTYYADKIKLVEETAKEADPYLYEYILKAVTEGLSYTYLRTIMEMPCGRDMFYDRYRKFFWLLSTARD